MIDLSICYVVGAGECKKLDFIPENDDLIIAADGGLEHLQKCGIKPDIIIGDFDSLCKNPQGENVIRLKPEKDITDMDAAVKVGIKKGYDEFKLYGALGGRLDHSVANIQLIASLAENKKKVEIISDETYITAVHNGFIEFDNEFKGYVSVFSHSDLCTGVSIKGLKYELDNAELKNTFPLGVSNEFINKESKITVKNGTLIIIIVSGNS